MGKIFRKTFIPWVHLFPDQKNPVQERLIIFTRYPEPGQTKTRLIPSLGEEGAARLQQQMTEHLVARARWLALDRPVEIEVRFAGGDAVIFKKWLGQGILYREQPEGDLGRKMAESFRQAFRQGAHRVVLAGSDCPGITPSALAMAFDVLREKDAVFGPASDGGYYLVGLRHDTPAIFQDIEWGSDKVLEDTFKRIEQEGLSYRLMEQKQDIDRQEDLEVWEKEKGEEVISVIIPALDEAGRIGETIQRALSGENVEVIVVDGGSRDETRQIARQQGAVVLKCSAHRGRQMNEGAAASRGEILLFLHADTRLPVGFDLTVRRCLQERNVAAGAFQFAVSGNFSGKRLVEWMVNLRSKIFGMPYGDQGLFLRRILFNSMGGYPQLRIMEDYEMVRRLKKKGRMRLLGCLVETSGRRWRKLGLLRTTFINQRLLLAYRRGVSEQTLLKIYRRNRYQKDD
jgi:uncharacterized protein